MCMHGNVRPRRGRTINPRCVAINLGCLRHRVLPGLNPAGSQVYSNVHAWKCATPKGSNHKPPVCSYKPWMPPASQVPPYLHKSAITALPANTTSAASDTWRWRAYKSLKAFTLSLVAFMEFSRLYWCFTSASA